MLPSNLADLMIDTMGGGLQDSQMGSGLAFRGNGPGSIRWGRGREMTLVDELNYANSTMGDSFAVIVLTREVPWERPHRQTD